MKMTTKGRYGLRVMLELALHHGQGPISADMISRQQEISSNYAHNLLKKLQEGDVIRITRGPGGGYELAHDPASITLLEILGALGESVCPVECVEHDECCNRSGACVAQGVWRRMSEAIFGVLRNTSLQELADEHRANHAG